MREDQLEALERVAAQHFPKGILVAAVLPNDSLHSAVICAKDDVEYANLLRYLRDLLVEEVDRLAEGNGEVY